MKFRKPLSLLLSATMVMGMASFAANAVVTNDSEVGAGTYYNASYLEDYAAKAFGEQNLGSTYSKTSTTWKTWSPDASSVQLKLYKTGSDSESGAGLIGTYDMSKNSETGVWSIKLDGDYKNVYYTYRVTVNGTTNETQDIYSKAVGVNGNRSMVVDLDSTDPDGWENDEHILFDSPAEAVVWEVHVRDFSASENSGVSEENKGKYLAFAEGGTTLNSDTSADAVSTGIDYLVEQGINCVQLMPVYDFQSVDESIASSSTNRNWGYDPQNYNVPEGSYSSNAYDGNVRITEFKQMIQALHDRGISVIMDVVYNHTYTTEGSCFSRTVPNYYYRMLGEGTYSNGSGCGNETASDKLMYRKYMTESLEYWAQEYHIDGFRFDLMGIHDIETMNYIRESIDNIYTDGSGKKIIMYGEPWSGGDVALYASEKCAQSNAAKINERVGMFCDSYRDAIKGGTNDASTGFVQGNTSKTATVVKGVQGKAFNALAPSQTIAYADAHDNLILWDKIVKSNGSTDWNSTSEELTAQMKEAFTLLFSSKGIVFATAGTEMCRAKEGDHNSYRSSDAINAIDWSRVQTYSNVVDYYKGLLQIRENYSPYTNNTYVDGEIEFQSSSGNVVAYTYSNDKTDEWGKVCTIINSGETEAEVTLPLSGWTIVADGNKAGLESLGTVSGNTYTIPARGSAILVETATFNRLSVPETEYGTLTINHVDDNGTVLKSTTSTYAEGSTYRSIPDSTILFDYNLIKTEGTTSGIVEGGKNYTVTYTYKSTGIKSGYLSVKYVDTDGETIKDGIKYHLRDGDTYEIPSASIQGYQLATSKYPAQSYGTFDGNDQTITFTYEKLEATESIVHYYNANNWRGLMCYSYTDDGQEPNGSWSKATRMTNDGDGWYSCVVPATSAYVMFHPKTGSGQEPSSGEQGYAISGEVWIKDRVVTFGSTVITSHIDIETGKRIQADSIEIQPQITSNDSYTTKPVAGRTDVITPVNAQGSYSAGIINVVYLYTDASDIVSGKILLGDVNKDGLINIEDVTTIQYYISDMLELDSNAAIAADVNGDNAVSVLDVTTIQRYIAKFTTGTGNTGTYYTPDVETPSTNETQPPTVPTTDPSASTEPTTEENTYKVYFTNNLKWSGTICCYYWDQGEDLTSWPGDEMDFVKTDENGWDVYSIEVPENTKYLIFNNCLDGSNQTVDIPFNGTSLSYYLTKKTAGGYGYTTTPPSPSTDPTEPTTEGTEHTVTFTNDLNWSGTISCYFWSDEDFPTVWPGEPMTFLQKNDKGQDVYTFVVPAGITYVIFNDGTNQTKDIDFDGTQLDFSASAYAQ